jgi:hypothetical protein
MHGTLSCIVHVCYPACSRIRNSYVLEVYGICGTHPVYLRTLVRHVPILGTCLNRVHFKPE